MRRFQPYAVALPLAVLGFAFGGLFWMLIALIVWGMIDQILRRHAGTWSSRRHPWQRLAR